MILKVKQNENPYDVIGNYIEKHIPVIDDIIAVISIDGEIRNELLLVDGEIGSTNNFVWQIDWWEGEENVELIDFFFVSDACKKNNNYERSDNMTLSEWKDGFKGFVKSLSIPRDDYKEIMEYIDDVPEPYWHPVSEQPQEDDDYLLLTHEKFKYGTFKRIIIGAWNNATKEWLEEYGDMYREVNHPVAWMSKEELLLLKGYEVTEWQHLRFLTQHQKTDSFGTGVRRWNHATDA